MWPEMCPEFFYKGNSLLLNQSGGRFESTPWDPFETLSGTIWGTIWGTISGTIWGTMAKGVGDNLGDTRSGGGVCEARAEANSEDNFRKHLAGPFRKQAR